MRSDTAKKWPGGVWNMPAWLQGSPEALQSGFKNCGLWRQPICRSSYPGCETSKKTTKARCVCFFLCKWGEIEASAQVHGEKSGMRQGKRGAGGLGHSEFY